MEIMPLESTPNSHFLFPTTVNINMTGTQTSEVLLPVSIQYFTQKMS
jgi:hypothetical protein